MIGTIEEGFFPHSNGKLVVLSSSNCNHMLMGIITTNYFYLISLSFKTVMMGLVKMNGHT